MGRGADEGRLAALPAFSRVSVMHLILCLDGHDGMAFNGRRQSRDKVQREKMLETVGEEKLFLRPATAAIFDVLPPNAEITEAKDFPAGTYFFAERAADLPNPSSVERLVIYRWGRDYPADEHVSLPAYTAGKRLISNCEFAGSSHLKMTEEVYE